MRLALAAFAALAAAATGPSPDTPEPGSSEAIRAATSDPRFVSPWVSSVPESTRVPSPSDHFGRIAGAPGELTYSEQAYAYYRALAAASPRVRVETLGRSEEGREILLVAIADEAGLAQLERLKAATAALADPRRTGPEQAERLIQEARPIYYFNAALHADETGSAEMALELAYRLAVSEQPMVQAIRRELVVLINPVSNPDGRDKMADWFYRYLKGKRDYAALPRQSPPYWSRYAFVDINRDTHQQAHAATRAVHRMFHDYHPTVVHDLHEAIALLLTWNGTGPYNPHLDPIATSEFLELSFHEVSTLSALGMPGVWTWKFGEGFGQHYLDSVAMNHNSLGRGYETWGNATAETVKRTLDGSDTTREWYRPWPPPREFAWSMRDNVNYQQTAALAALDYAARQPRELLRNFYQKGLNSWRKGREEAPFAFVIPEDQGDRLRVAALVNRLRDQRIEVARARTALRAGGRSFPAGSYVVRLDQPYRNYALDLLAPQEFPKDSTSQPYDDISWALPVHYRLQAEPVADPAIREVPLEPLDEELKPAGVVAGAGPTFLLADTGQESLLAARYRLAPFRVEIAERAFRAGDRDYNAGSWILPGQDGLAEALRKVAAELALDFASAVAPPEAPRHPAPPPRLAVWVPWADTDASGWVRYSLEQRGIPYSYLRDEDVRAGSLREKADVIVYGHVNLELAEQIHGLPRVWGPLAFKATPETPHLGTPAESDDITGGIGYAGLAELQRFVEQGGLLATLGSGTALALEAGIVRGVRRAEPRGIPLPSDGTGAPFQDARVSTPGSHLRATFARPDHPLAYGYPARLYVFRANFPVYEAPRRWLGMSYCTSCLDGPLDRSGVVLEWGDREGAPLVVSGGARGEQQLVGAPAILDLPLGRGRVVAYNFNPLHRDLNRGDHRLLWNALLNWSALGGR
jgi:hypothetical protein